MPLYVFECEKCGHELKHLTSAALNSSYSEDCKTCNDRTTFKFVREGNREQDWFSNILINNKRRRPGDHLYTTKESRKKSKSQPPLKKAS